MTSPRHKIRAVTVNGMTHYAYAATSDGDGCGVGRDGAAIAAQGDGA